MSSIWTSSLPDGWTAKPLKYVASCNDEVLREDTDANYQIEYIEISDVKLGKGIENSTTMQFGDAPSRARRVVRDGDIIVSTVRTYLRAIASVTSPSSNAIASTGFAVLRPRDIDSSYLGYLFHHDDLIGQIISRSVGVSYPAINASEIMGLDVPVPPLEEQQIIAAYLDREAGRIDALVGRLERLIALLTEKRQAVISHAVTKGLNPDAPMKDSGIDWLGEVPAHWEVLQLRHCVHTIEQGWSPECEDRTKADDEWGVLKSGCVNRGIFRAEEHKTLPDGVDPRPHLEISEGDVLMCRASGSIDLLGSVAVVRDPPTRLMFSDKTYRFKFEARVSEPEYIVHSLSSVAAREQIELSVSGAEGLANNISKEAVKSIWVALAPSLEQQELVGWLEAELVGISAMSSRLAELIAKAKERRSALISAAVTGQIPITEMTPDTQPEDAA